MLYIEPLGSMLYSDLLEFGGKVQESAVLNLKILDTVASRFKSKILRSTGLEFQGTIPRF